MPSSQDVTFRKIKIFLCFMEWKNLGKTAEILNINKVSVHKALHSLESDLRCPLFKREGRNLIPLKSATVFAEHCQKISNNFQFAVDLARETAGFASNKLILGSLYSLTVSIIPKIISGLKIRRNQLDIQLVFNSNEQLLTKLYQHELDAVLIVLDKDSYDGRLEIIPIFHDEICLAMHQNDPMARQEHIDLEYLRYKNFLTLNKGFATRLSSDQLFQKAGFFPTNTMQLNDIFTLISLVNSGIGYALLPKRMAAVYANTVKLISLPPSFKTYQEIGLVFPKNKERDPNILALIAESRMLAHQWKSHI